MNLDIDIFRLLFEVPSACVSVTASIKISSFQFFFQNLFSSLDLIRKQIYLKIN